jgi:hypothetical protein
MANARWRRESMSWEPWSARHLHWARAIARDAGLPEDAFTSFVRALPGSRMGRESVPERNLFAPLWLHAFWDVATEEHFDRDEAGHVRKVPITTNIADRVFAKLLVERKELRRALEVVYDETRDPNRTADFVVAVALGELKEQDGRSPEG